jgi:hypothetical protein
MRARALPGQDRRLCLPPLPSLHPSPSHNALDGAGVATEMLAYSGQRLSLLLVLDGLPLLRLGHVLVRHGVFGHGLAGGWVRCRC